MNLMTYIAGAQTGCHSVGLTIIRALATAVGYMLDFHIHHTTVYESDLLRYGCVTKANCVGMDYVMTSCTNVTSEYNRGVKPRIREKDQ